MIKHDLLCFRSSVVLFRCRTKQKTFIDSSSLSEIPFPCVSPAGSKGYKGSVTHTAFLLTFHWNSLLLSVISEQGWNIKRNTIFFPSFIYCQLHSFIQLWETHPFLGNILAVTSELYFILILYSIYCNVLHYWYVSSACFALQPIHIV